MSKITFLGGGSFGTALATLLAKKGNRISIWDRDASVVKDINENRKNSRYMKELVIPENITAHLSMEEALVEADYVIVSVPSHVVRSLCEKAKAFIPKKAIIISIAKGIEEGSLKRISEIIEEELGNPVVILSGPSHAEEVAIEIPTTVVVSSRDMKYAEIAQDLFMTPNFRVYTNEDLIGVEIGGAVKNIIALAAGVSDGLGYGDNTKAALMTRGMSEIIRIGIKMGGNHETFSGLTGMGDLIVTCTSMHSRNRRAGILIGKGKTMEEAVEEIGMVVEGIKACKAFYQLKEREEVSMPITDVLYNVLFNNMNPINGVADLMLRDKKSETY
ncbi:NAD(P)H-dependent glycerol-3-phosphate dehydrogenase [Desnuesiella massiliensis]|uniref:NAD(P)H-dependent glycerol-3-phosphate dehydrogenase n=1 Tax=Desnuesiella massiliensis TaxID=1650662 RepID=UPI0006E2EC2B|nr:NAD(P)H-dependent glycerol-3-phosphate dehydrogenase [Desnuesiella massiliensis]